MKRYFMNLLISIDQFFNTVIGGDPDETISSRGGKYIRSHVHKRSGFWYWLCKALHWFDPNHCIDAIEEDEGEST